MYPHTTLENNRGNRITWALKETMTANNQAVEFIGVWTAAEITNMTTGEPVVIKEKIMSAKNLWKPLNATESFKELWVFDSWIVIRTNYGNLYWYEKSTLFGGTKTETLLVTNGVNFTMNQQKEFDTIEFGRDETNSSRCFLYGTKGSKVYKQEFFIDLDASPKKVIRENQYEQNFESFSSGKLMASLVTKNYFIVSCGDCAEAQVVLFNHDLEEQETFKYGSPSNNTINLAVSEPSRREMQLFTGFYNRIDAIIMQENTKSEPFFKKINNLFSVPADELNTTVHSIEVGKSPNYLIFKLQSRPYMYLMATCMYNQFFDSDSFACESCRPAHHSFGLQEENCYPCNTLWMSS
jgi:hypothetical protein